MITCDNNSAVKNFAERFYPLISISADYVFEYTYSDEVFKLYENNNGEFSKIMILDKDFDQYFKDKGIVSSDDTDAFERLCDNVKSGIDRAVFELRFSDTVSGDYSWFRIKMTVECDENSCPVKIMGKLENISDIKTTEKLLIDKAERDPLTKVYNKSTTRRMIKNYLRTDSRDTYDAFVIIDVDNFKQVNDTLGHLFGDSILSDLSQEMQDLFRSNDVVGRIGGDEFIVFLRGMKQKSHIESKANDICKIFDLLYAGEDGTKITGSLGIALYPDDGDTFDELYRKADLALYASKRAGKSCYSFYTNESEDKTEAVGLPRLEQYRRNIDFLRSNSDFDVAILDSVFDISDNGEEMELYDFLYKIGKHFNLSRVSVYEFDMKYGCFEITEQWNGKYGSSTRLETFPILLKKLLNARIYFDDNGIFVADFERKELTNFEVFLEERNVKACLACGCFKKGRLVGFISFEECVAPRIWSIEEAKSALAAAEAVFSHYLKIRDSKG